VGVLRLAAGSLAGTGQMLRMARVGGARATPFGEHLGTLAVGKGADMVLIDWHSVAFPCLDEETKLLDAVMQRAKASAVRQNIRDGEVERRKLCKALLPQVRKFRATWLDPSRHEPFHRPSSMV
jgi:cytosine/adenosine deaminase-related metal-dependent hydrolase